jgi:hypothetical protein
MDELFSRAWEQLLSRAGGPLHLRFILQPMAALILAIRAGMKDAKAGRSPYLWTMLFEPGERRGLIRDGLKDVGRVFAVTVAVDCIYQIIEFHWIYPIQALIVAFVLAIIPYVVVRGPVTRIASWITHNDSVTTQPRRS